VACRDAKASVVFIEARATRNDDSEPINEPNEEICVVIRVDSRLI
jgi:hypothetical protein